MSNICLSTVKVTLEFSANDDAPVNLSEMRFHIPITELAGDVDPAEAFKGQTLNYTKGL